MGWAALREEIVEEFAPLCTVTDELQCGVYGVRLDRLRAHFYPRDAAKARDRNRELAYRRAAIRETCLVVEAWPCANCGTPVNRKGNRSRPAKTCSNRCLGAVEYREQSAKADLSSLRSERSRRIAAAMGRGL
jgi:hypothetical protein